MQTHRDAKTPAEQIAIAESIFQEVLAARIDHTDLQQAGQLLSALSEKHKDFYTTHPLAVRYMCYLRAYDSGAFSGYLAKIAKNPATIVKVDGFLEAQADYVVRLARVGNKLTGSETRELKREILGQLRDEYADMQETYKNTKAALDAADEQRLAEIRKEFQAAISIEGVGSRSGQVIVDPEVARLGDTPRLNLDCVGASNDNVPGSDKLFTICADDLLGEM